MWSSSLNSFIDDIKPTNPTTLGDKVKVLFELRYVFCILLKIKTIRSNNFSLNFLDNKSLSDRDIDLITELLDLTVSQDTFHHNINTIGGQDNKEILQVMNIYSQFGPHSALQNLLRNRAYISSAVGRLETSLLNVVVVLTSSEKIDMEGVRRILKMSRDGAPLPASKYSPLPI